MWIRWNDGTGKWEKSINSGVNWADLTINNPVNISLDAIGNPAGNKTFSMANKTLVFSYSAPIGADGAFEIEGVGGFSGDLVHLHQHTGSPAADVDILHVEAAGANPRLVRLTRAASTGQIISGFVGVEANERFRILVDGSISWGAGGASALDTTLNRHAAGVLATGSLALGTTPASAGQIRLPNNTLVNWRNAANGADIGLKVNTSDELEVAAATLFKKHIRFDTSVTYPGTGTISKSATSGLWIGAVTGSIYDFIITRPDGNSAIMVVPTGTVEPHFNTGLWERNRSVAMGDWTTYTPTGSNSNGGFSLGNGALYGYYSKIGKTVFYSIRLALGSSTNLGNVGGAVFFTLPSTAADGFSRNGGVGKVLDVGINWYFGQLHFVNTSNVGILQPGGTWFTPASPITSGGGDEWWLNGWYQEV